MGLVASLLLSTGNSVVPLAGLCALATDMLEPEINCDRHTGGGGDGPGL